MVGRHCAYHGVHRVGGWFSDKYGAHFVTWWVLWVGLVCLFFLSYPQTEFTIHTVSGPKTFHLGLNATVFTVIMFTMGIAFAIGKASAFMLMFGIVWVSLMWMYFTEVRPMSAEQASRHPEPAHFS